MDKEQNNNWQQSKLGGGGYITGILQNPLKPEILYARCDVGGVFKSKNGGKKWSAINNGMTKCHHHSVQSFAISHSQPDVLFRCSGEARGNKIFGTIHKSINGGASWYEVSNDIDFYGNGPSRMYGEVIKVNPLKPEIVVAGGYSKGVWISNDAGENFKFSALKGERIGCLSFHNKFKDRIYAGTISDLAIDRAAGKSGEGTDEILAALHDFPRGDRGSLYLSPDNGQSWNKINNNYNFSELVFDEEDPDLIYAASITDGIIRSDDGGYSWYKINNGLPEGLRYGTITMDKTNSILYCAPDIRPKDSDLAAISIYYSKDKGESWHLIKAHNENDLLNYPDYIHKRPKRVGWAISKIRVDLKDSNKLYMSNWFGVSVSEDRGNSWNGNDFAGTETTCIEDILTDPKKEKSYITVADHAPKYSLDDGENYQEIAKIQEYPDSTALIVSRFDNDFLIYGARNRDLKKNNACLLKSVDGGKSVKMIKKFKKGLFVQALAEDYFEQGTFYAYLEGEIKKGAGLYQSVDYGESWEKLDLDLPAGIKTLPHQKYWIETELLSVVVYQIKNACGTNQLLATDPHQKNTIYLGEWTEGLFKSADSGESWVNIGRKLPFKQNKASVLNCIELDENRPGVIYAGFIREGLWRSQDFGETWNKIFPTDNSIFNVSSMSVGGVTGAEIYIASEPLYWSQSESAIYYSSNYGENWTDISDPGLGAIRWKGITVNKKTGTIHAASCGNGVFYKKN
jgi:photosystem II stability/assembly factor-like uncharacterized protein